MCFDSDSLPPIPVLSGAAVSHDDLVLDRLRRQPVRCVPGRPGGVRRGRRRDPPGRPRALPLLRGARAPLRRARLRRRRDRLLRPHGGRRQRDDDFEYMPHVAETSRSSSRRTSRLPSSTSAGSAARRSSRSASASAAATRGLPPRPATGSNGAVGFYGFRPSGTAPSALPSARVRSRRRSSRCRPAQTEHHGGRERRLRGCLTQPASTTSSSSTTAPRTASSTASKNSSPRPPRTPGTRRLGSSSDLVPDTAKRCQAPLLRFQRTVAGPRATRRSTSP